MNVLFLIPPSPGKRRILRLIECSYETKAAYLWQPYDYLIISSLLSSDASAVLIDGTADRFDETEFFRELAATPPPDLIFFSLSSTCWESDLRIYRRTREIYAETPMYLVGDLFLEDRYLEFAITLCEGVVYNPYLLDIKAMASQPERGNMSLPGLRRPAAGAKTATDTKYLLQSGIPRHELFQKKGYVFPFARHAAFTTVNTSWGCPFSCSYCNLNSIYPVVRPWQDVVGELEYIASLGIKEVFFSDKAFGYPPVFINLLLDEMHKRFSFAWSCYFHPQMYRPELLEKMSAAGCHTIIVGLESADQEKLRKYGRKVRSETVHLLLDHANRLGMDVCADFIIGLEHETEKDVERTIEYALSQPLDFVSINLAAPLPGSALRRQAVASGKMVFGEEGYDTLGRSGALDSGCIDRERLVKLRNSAVRRFYLRPGCLLRRLRKTVSLEHLLIQMRQMAALFAKN